MSSQTHPSTNKIKLNIYGEQGGHVVMNIHVIYNVEGANLIIIIISGSLCVQIKTHNTEQEIATEAIIQIIQIINKKYNI